METFEISGERFEPGCIARSGQIFRAAEENGSYVFLSAAHFARVSKAGAGYLVESDDSAYFRRFFDEDTDYGGIYDRAVASGVPLLAEAAKAAPGMRVLRADPFEAIFSFIVSQNNNVGRIRSFLGGVAEAYGDRLCADGRAYCAFPRAEQLPLSPEKYAALGAGYRAAYLASFVRGVREGWDCRMEGLSPAEIRGRLQALYGVGRKVADCAALFGFHLTECFPVDTWIFKAYREMGGGAADPVRAAEELSAAFGGDSGYFQQYIFYYKRLTAGARG